MLSIVYTSVLLATTTVLLYCDVDARQIGLCKETKHSVDTGLVRVPDFQDDTPLNVTCTWSYSAPSGKKLLVKVDNVHLPPPDIRESTLKLVLDNEIIDIPRNCVRSCLKQTVSGYSIQVMYTSTVLVPNTDDPLLESSVPDIGSFQIRYKSFDPSLCDKPRSPTNGFATVLGRKLNQEVQYHCNQPYDLFGKNSSICQLPIDSPVPEWSQGPPKCILSNCTAGPLIRNAGTGAIASPGYPEYKINSSLNCEYLITANRGYQIATSVTFIELAHNGLLSLFDGEDKTLLAVFNSSIQVPQNVTTNTNLLTVAFRTTNPSVTEIGFYLQYSAIPGVCKEPKLPKFGEVVGYSFGVGSNIAYRCDKGYLLEGNATSECLLDGTWSGDTPTCIVPNVTVQMKSSELSTTTDSELLSADNPIEFSDSETQFSNAFVSTSTLPPTEVSTQSLENITNSSDYSEGLPLKVHKSSKKTLYLTSKMPNKPTPKPKDGLINNFINTTTESPPAKQSGNKTENEIDQASSSNGVSSKEKQIKSQTVRGPKVLSNPNEFPSMPNGVVKEADILPIGGPSPRPGKNHQKPDEMSNIVLYAIIGSSVGALMIIIAIVATLVVYRKRFPVRMRFGRKFSTFENPMYAASKDQDAHHPRELKRLTS